MDITPVWLRNYESSQLKNGISLTTVGINLRHLRAIFNKAIAENMVNKDLYPFKAYVIPKSRNIKKALSPIDIRKLLNYTPTGENYIKALDFWKFSYLVNGINISDIANLKYENINGNLITFFRNKTRFTSRSNSKPIRAALTSYVREIIQKWGDPDTHPAKYIFPFLITTCLQKKRK